MPQNIKDCVILGPGLANLFFGHHQEPQEGLYLHEAQKLAEIMMKTITWMGQAAHQQVFPIMIAEGRRVISMSRTVNKHRDLQFPMETLWAIKREARVMSSGTDEDEDGGTHVPSLTITFVGRRRHARGQCRVWMTFVPLPGFKSNPEPYAIPSISKLSSTSHNDSYPDRGSTPPYPLPPPPILASLMPAPPVTQATAPAVQANVASVTIPTPTPVVNPVAPATALVIVVGGPPDPSPPPPPGSEPGSTADFNHMSVSKSSTSSASSVQGNAPHPQIPTGGFHLPDLTSLTDTMAYKMWKNTIGFFHLIGTVYPNIPLSSASLHGHP